MFLGIFFCSRPVSVVFATDLSAFALCKGSFLLNLCLDEIPAPNSCLPDVNNTFFHVQIIDSNAIANTFPTVAFFKVTTLWASLILRSHIDHAALTTQSTQDRALKIRTDHDPGI